MTRVSCGLAIIAAVLAGCGRAPAPGPELVREGGRWVPAAGSTEGAARGELALIRRHVERGKNRKAIRRAKKFLKRFPADERGEEVLMLAARAQMNRGRYMKAYEWYERQLDQYPAGKYFDRAIDREFQIAEAFLAGRKQVVWGFLYLSAKAEALEILTRIAEHVPGSIRAEEALLRIGDDHFENKRYVEAAEAYDNYLALFGKSVRAGYATFRSGQAVLATFRGIPYDGTPLIEAELRFRDLAEKHPAAVGPAGIDAILKDIAALRSRKDYDTAEFYQRTGRPEAARFYYQEASLRYGRGKWSRKAEEALRRLGPARRGEKPLQGAGPTRQ